ncbi:MAG: hypothetical protein V3T23_11500 [Nitrososphaerales archaeon]
MKAVLTVWISLDPIAVAGRIILFSIILLVLILGVYHRRIIRVYTVVSLFEPDVIVQNFPYPGKSCGRSG